MARLWCLIGLSGANCRDWKGWGDGREIRGSEIWTLYPSNSFISNFTDSRKSKRSFFGDYSSIKERNTPNKPFFSKDLIGGVTGPSAFLADKIREHPCGPIRACFSVHSPNRWRGQPIASQQPRQAVQAVTG